MADKQWDILGKAKLEFVIEMIRQKVQGWLSGYAKKEDLEDITVTADPSLDKSSSNPIQNAAVANALDSYATLNSPEFTGTPKAPLATADSNDMQIANTAFVKQAIQSRLSDFTGLDIEVLDSLPTDPQPKTLYYVRIPGAEGQNRFYEYMYIDGELEKIGDGEIDLSNYVKQSELVEISEEDIVEMFADW